MALRCIQIACFRLAFRLHFDLKISKTNDMENGKVGQHAEGEWMPNTDEWNLHSILSWNVKLGILSMGGS